MLQPDPVQQLTGQCIAIEIAKNNIPHYFEKDRGLDSRCGRNACAVITALFEIMQ